MNDSTFVYSFYIKKHYKIINKKKKYNNLLKRIKIFQKSYTYYLYHEIVTISLCSNEKLSRFFIENPCKIR